MFYIEDCNRKFKKDKNLLFLGFVDFQKVYDSVWHTGLLYKLTKSGITGNFYKVIRYMYSKILVAVQAEQRLSSSFKS